ncbi:unnamed protein product [Rotaria sp. Silwood1]|nr:unnamed protein product [Rotaria sp. Silwood1]CAF4878160.1 unnamed protein product [Rotaria sp. Silwood1]
MPPITIFATPTTNDNKEKEQDRSHTDINGDFIFIQTFIETLIRMSEKALSSKHELIELCHDNYKNSECNMKIIDEFDNNYSVETSLWWYTRESLFYRILNKSLREQNIAIMYKFRFLIVDLYRQLKELQEKNVLTFDKTFRFQLMSKEELEELKNSIGQHVSMNSFLSTTIDRYMAEFLLSSWLSRDESDNNLTAVLFEIDIGSTVTTRPFAEITTKSFFQDEKECLFMLGSVFRIEDIKLHDSDRYWLIRLKLIDENSHQLKDVFNQIKSTMEEQTNMFSVCLLLITMNRYDEAENLFQQLFKNLADSDVFAAGRYYQGLGAVYLAKGDYDLAITLTEKAIQLFQKVLNNDIYLAHCYGNLGACYIRKHMNETALISMKQTLNIYLKNYGENNLETALIYLNLGALTIQIEEYNDALVYCKKALESFEKHFSADHRYIANCYCNIGVIYWKLKQYDLALSYYEKQLNIQLKTLPANHFEFGVTFLNIGELYEARNEFELALSFYSKANEIFQKSSLLPTHEAVIELQQHIQTTIEKISHE